MAEINYDDAGEFGAPETSISTLINLGGAVVSLALIAGLGVWGYELFMRDVNGVPVVRALEGPMRVAPDNPGGVEAPHQGLAVNTVAADNGPEEPAERLVLAPAPIELDGDDQPVASLLPDTPVGEDDADVAATTPLATETGDADPGTSITAIAEPDTAPPVLDQAEGQSAIEAAIAEALGEAPVTEGAVRDGVISSTVPGVSTSLRPAERPTRITGVIQTSSAAATTNGGAASAVPGDPPEAPEGTVMVMTATGDWIPSDEVLPEPGTRLVQLGAYASKDVARSEWVSLSGQFSDYFVGKERLIMEASAGGKTFFRLRVIGFEDLAAARRFCAVLVADNANCIPVVQR